MNSLIENYYPTFELYQSLRMQLLDILSDDEAQRWANIRRTFTQNVKMRGIDQEDQVGQVVVQLREFSDGLHSIQEAMNRGVKQLQDRPRQGTGRNARRRCPTCKRGAHRQRAKS